MKLGFFCLFWLPALLLQAAGPLVPRVHDPSTLAKCKGEYWVFCTGTGILSRHSKDLKEWQAGPPVFTNAPAWAARAVPGNTGHFWAPDIIAVSNRFLLYYSVSTWGSRVSAIGLASNVTLDPQDPNYQWVDLGCVFQSSDADAFNAIDPSVIREPDGNMWMAFGSFWSGIKLMQLDPQTGRRLAPDSPIYSLASNASIEAACIYRHGEFYYLFVNWGQCCRGVDSTYEIRVGRSPRITGPYLDRSGASMESGGGSLFLATTGTFIGPGHAGVLMDNGAEWLSCHFYDGTRRGAPILEVRQVHWTNSWPTVALTPEQ